jgi:hypothetical protein
VAVAQAGLVVAAAVMAARAEGGCKAQNRQQRANCVLLAPVHSLRKLPGRWPRHIPRRGG